MSCEDKVGGINCAGHGLNSAFPAAPLMTAQQGGKWACGFWEEKIRMWP